MAKKTTIKKIVNKKVCWCNKCHFEIEPYEWCYEIKESGKKKIKICYTCHEKM